MVVITTMPKKHTMEVNHYNFYTHWNYFIIEHVIQEQLHQDPKAQTLILICSFQVNNY